MSAPSWLDRVMKGVCRQGFIPIILLVALGQAVLYGFVLTPPWQAPDEPGHYEYVRELSEYGVELPAVSEREEVQREIIHSLEDERFWEFLGRSVPNPLPQIFLQDPYLNSQREDEPPLYYLLPAVLLDRAQTILDGLYLIRGWSIVLYLVTIGFACLGLKELSQGDAFIPIVGGLLAVLMPMPAFIGSSANNDVAAMAASTIVFWLLIRNMNQRWPAGGVIALLIMLIVSGLTKKTTLFLWPLAGMVAIVDNWRDMWGWIVRNRRVMPSVILLVLSAVIAVWNWRIDAAAGWIHLTDNRVARRVMEPVHSGAYALRIEPQVGVEPGRALQELSHNKAARYRGQVLTLSAQIAGVENAGAGYLVVYDGKSSSRTAFRVRDNAWQEAEVTHRVATDADRLGVVLANSGMDTLVCDSIALRNPAGENILTNGCGETPAHWIEEWVARQLALPPGLMPHLFEPASYSLGSLKRYLLYLGLTFAGFWANFGWLTVPLDPQWYLVPALLCVGAAAGLLLRWRRRRAGKDPMRSGLIVAILALFLIGAQTFLPMIGSAWQPQGRYMFPAILPVVALLASGWRELAPARGLLILGLFLVAGFIAFGQLCIWNYVIPAYS